MSSKSPNARSSIRKIQFSPTGLVIVFKNHPCPRAETFHAIRPICTHGFLTAFNLFLQHGKTLFFPSRSWTSWFKTNHGYICSEVTQLVLEDLIRFNRIPFTFPKAACITEPDDYLKEFWDVTVIK